MGSLAVANAITTDELELIKQSGKPVLALSGMLPLESCPTVLPDNAGGMALAVEHLLGHEHTRIAFLGFFGHQDIRERYEGYGESLRIRHGRSPAWRAAVVAKASPQVASPVTSRADDVPILS